MYRRLVAALVCAIAFSPAAPAAEARWWNPQWSWRTTVARATPYRDSAPRPVEAVVDFAALLDRAGAAGQFDPASLRVIERQASGPGREVPYAWRTEFDARKNRQQRYITWQAQPGAGAYDLYFAGRDRGIRAPSYDARALPAENLLANSGWQVSPASAIRAAKPLKLVVDENTPRGQGREVTVSQRIDVRHFAGQEVVFECELLAERAAYGAPVTIELQQYRADGSPIMEYAVDPRWLSLELARGQLVQFSERGRFSHDAATVDVRFRFRLQVKDADSGSVLTGPESFFTVRLDRVVVRPGERWPWPAASNAGFVAGALQNAPLNRAFEFTGQRRLAFNGGSEGSLTAGRFNPDPRADHWGPEAGTLEFWCRPSWDSRDGAEHWFFEGKAYLHKSQSLLRSVGGELEFAIADAAAKQHTVRGPAQLKKGQWHHIAATWDFAQAQLQLFVDGKRIGRTGPGNAPWPASGAGRGIDATDTRSIPMQAFIGGDQSWQKERAADAVIDEFRVSDVPRYSADFTSAREEFRPDEHTRALFHFENERDGVHGTDDRFVRGHLACELPPQLDSATLQVFRGGHIESLAAVVNPAPAAGLFAANRAENRMTVTRPFKEPPDPRFIEYRPRSVTRTLTGKDDEFTVKTAGDYPPLMRSIEYKSAAKTVLLPHWRANDNVVPASFETIAATIAPGARTDLEKAFAAFKYAVDVTNYFNTAEFAEILPDGRVRPGISYTLIRALNSYPHNQCGPLNHTLRQLFLAAGLSSSNASGTHHQYEQVYCNGSLRLFDLSPRMFWLERDDATVLSWRGLEDDPYLKLRQGGDANAWLRGRVSRATFGNAERPHSMDFPLRPGERVSLCWHNEGRWFENTAEGKPVPLAQLPPYFGNGAIVFEPTSAGDGVTLKNAAEHAVSLVYRLRSPYILSDARTGGIYTGARPGAIVLSLSYDEGKTWHEAWRNPDAKGTLSASLLDRVTGRYAYWLKLEMAAGNNATVSGFKVRSVFVVSPFSLPGKLAIGENRIRFTAAPASPLVTECRWVERYRSDLGVSVEGLNYYLNGDETHRTLLVLPPGPEREFAITFQGRPMQGEVRLEGLPEGWVRGARTQAVRTAGAQPSTVKFTLVPGGRAGDIRGFDVVMREGGRERRVSAQALIAPAALVSEAESAESNGAVRRATSPAASDGAIMRFAGDGRLNFKAVSVMDATYALWVRARWEPGADTGMQIAVNGGAPRKVRASALIGFSDWNESSRAHTKMFAHFGEQYAHWSWYRIPGVRLNEGTSRLTLAAGAGAELDSIVLLPETPEVDRSAMNLFQNWNYAPWQNPQ